MPAFAERDAVAAPALPLEVGVDVPVECVPDAVVVVVAVVAPEAGLEAAVAHTSKARETGV